MKLQSIRFVGLILFATIAPSADAQLLGRWFGPKSTDKNPPAKPAQPDSRRITEVNVEIAWLADPVTFPYYLEARAASGQLEVRGYVPSKAVREHALRIAQVHSSLPVSDAMKEHPSLLVKSSKMSPQQLQSSVHSSLRVALPKQYQQLRAECGSDGKVYVVGPVSTYEEKMVVSHSLRRLHGCTSVQNLTTLPAEVAQVSAKMPIVKGPPSSETNGDKPVASVENKSKPWFAWPFGKNQTTREEPPLLDVRKPDSKGPTIIETSNPRVREGPILIPNIPEPLDKPRPIPELKVEPAAPKALTAAELQKRIQAACPEARGVEVQFVTGQEVRITLEIPNEKSLAPTAERVFAMPELQNYRPELQFKITAP